MQRTVDRPGGSRGDHSRSNGFCGVIDLHRDGRRERRGTAPRRSASPPRSRSASARRCRGAIARASPAASVRVHRVRAADGQERDVRLRRRRAPGRGRYRPRGSTCRPGAPARTRPIGSPSGWNSSASSAMLYAGTVVNRTPATSCVSPGATGVTSPDSSAATSCGATIFAPGAREPRDLVGLQVIVVRVRDQDQVGGRGVLVRAPRIDVDRALVVDPPERGLAEPRDAVEHGDLLTNRSR